MRSNTIFVPVDIGDRVFRSFSWVRNGAVCEYEVTNFVVSKNKKGEVKIRIRAMFLQNGKTADAPLDFSPDEIGVNVFATREEAERRTK